MKTALMGVPHLVTNDSAAVESAVDAYANKVLQTMSPPETNIDSSLGPYVTSLLRCSGLQDKEEVPTLPDFEALLELLEDQGNMQADVATNALKTIADAVFTGIVPHDTSAGTPRGIFTGNGLDSFRTLSSALPDALSGTAGNRSEQTMIDPYTPNSTGAPSPLKPDNLIPVDLLGALDDPSPHFSRYGHQKQFQQQPQIVEEAPSHEEAFPPLGSRVSAPPKKSGRGKKASKTHSDKDLAASLFRPARPRQNSIDKEDSPPLKPSVPNFNRIARASHNKYFQQQWDSCVEILLSMNPELSEEAAAEAGLMAQTDFNIAQYVVDAAMSAPPVCRHMLNDGCYRSDCQFSHDVEGHTCLFWLRGRCGKGTSCKFLHGFNEKLLDGIEMKEEAPSQQPGRSAPVKIAQSNGGGYSSPMYSSFQPSSAPTSESFGGFSLPSRGFDTSNFEDVRLGSSWQSPRLTESYMLRGPPRQSRERSNTASSFSFANIASRGYDEGKFSASSAEEVNPSSSLGNIGTVRIPQDLWNPHENRDSTVFHITDPFERYEKVSQSVSRKDVIDLHFQSTKTFPVVLESELPMKLSECGDVWVVTGTGHHVGSKTHQKSGGALERSVISWLTEKGYNILKGRDRNGLGGALLVKR